MCCHSFLLWSYMIYKNKNQPMSFFSTKMCRFCLSPPFSLKKLLAGEGTASCIGLILEAPLRGKTRFFACFSAVVGCFVIFLRMWMSKYSCAFFSYPPRKLTWNLHKGPERKRKQHLQTSPIFGFNILVFEGVNRCCVSFCVPLFDASCW